MYQPRILLTLIKLILLMLAVLMAGCTTVTAPQPVTTQANPTWYKQQAQLKQLTSWNLQGRVAVNAGSRGGSASLFWKQTNQNYLIELFGPLGAGAVYLQGTPGQILLTSARGQHLQAQSPEQLLQQEFGWQIPVTHLYYWVRGIPAPHETTVTLFDNQGQLAQLNQEGWQVKYLSYASVNGIPMPQQLLLTGQGIIVHLIIDQWHVVN